MSYRKIAALALIATSVAAAQGQVAVDVGYADNAHISAFFPTDFYTQSAPNTVYFDGASGNAWDCGVIRITNTSGAALTLTGFDVNVGASYGFLWAGAIGTTILPGHALVFGQTASYNFDSSDFGFTGIPTVSIALNGGPAMTLLDTGQVLNTGGSDFLASQPQGEGYNWRPISGSGTQAGTPAPAAALPMLAGLILRRRRAAK